MLPGLRDSQGRIIANSGAVPADAPFWRGVAVSPDSEIYIDAGSDPTKTLDIDFLNSGPLDIRITFTRTTIGTYLGAEGLLKTASINEPRFEYDSNGNALGLLIEGERTNSFLHSDAPVDQSVTITAAQWTLSFYGTGTITYSGAATGSLVGSGVFPTRASVTITGTVADLALAITGTVEKVQLELGPSASSYIPTTTSAVTRAADNASMTGTNFSSWYDKAKGSFAAQILMGYVGSQHGVLSMQNQNLPLRLNATSYVNTFLTPAIGPFLTGVTLQNVVSRHSFAYQDGASAFAKCAANGVLSATVTGTSAINNTSLDLGKFGADYMFGHFQRLVYWNRALTDAEMIDITGGARTRMYPTTVEGALQIEVDGITEAYQAGIAYTADGRICAKLNAAPHPNDRFIAGVRVTPEGLVHFVTNIVPPLTGFSSGFSGGFGA